MPDTIPKGTKSISRFKVGLCHSITRHTISVVRQAMAAAKNSNEVHRESNSSRVNTKTASGELNAAVNPAPPPAATIIERFLMTVSGQMLAIACPIAPPIFTLGPPPPTINSALLAMTVLINLITNTRNQRKSLMPWSTAFKWEMPLPADSVEKRMVRPSERKTANRTNPKITQGPRIVC